MPENSTRDLTQRLRKSSKALRNYRKRYRAQLQECQEKKVKKVKEQEEKASIAFQKSAITKKNVL